MTSNLDTAGLVERGAKALDALTTDDLPDEFIGHEAGFADALNLGIAAIRKLMESSDEA